MRIVNISILLLLFTTTSIAQTRPFDNTEVKTLAPKALQNENYYGNTKVGLINDHSYNMLLRYGLKKNIELQVSWNGNVSAYDNSKNGSSSTSIGLKLNLLADSRCFPALGLIGTLNLTPHTNSFPAMPSLNLLFDKKLGNALKINGNYKIGLDEKSGDFSTKFSINLDIAVTDWQTTYIGFVTNGLPVNDIIQNTAFVELGMLFWVKSGITLYPYYDYSINDNSNDIINLGLLFTLNK